MNIFNSNFESIKICFRDDLQWSEEKIEDWTSREIARWGYSM
jgi:hypothetical protein